MQTSPPGWFVFCNKHGSSKADKKSSKKFASRKISDYIYPVIAHISNSLPENNLPFK